MASLDGMQMFDPSGHDTTGGAFLLSAQAKASHVETAIDGWHVEIKRGSNYVVARTTRRFKDLQDRRESAFGAAQKALDLMSVCRIAILAIKKFGSEDMTWWCEGDDQVLRLTDSMIVPMKLSIGPMTVRDHSGNIIPPPPKPPIIWHESMRHFRLFQATDDLFVAFRHLYLALESIFDLIAPQRLKASGKPDEMEGEWFKRALVVAGGKLTLGHFAPRGVADPVQSLFDELYLRARTALFHAKASRASFLPHSPGSKGGADAISSAVARLARLYVELARQVLNVRLGTSVITHAGFDAFTAGLKDKVRVQATDSGASSGQEDEEVTDLRDAVIVDLTTRHAPDLEVPSSRSFFATADEETLRKIARLGSLVVSINDQGVAFGQLKGELLLHGFNRLECQIDIRLRNADLPKSDFAC